MQMESASLKKIGEISVGDRAYFAKTVTEADVMMFAQLSGDYAPHHVNKEFGDTTVFRSRIAHGMLTAGLICPVLTKLCGGASYTYSQEIRFKSAVLLNDTITVPAPKITAAIPLPSERAKIYVALPIVSKNAASNLSFCSKTF